MRFDRPVGVRKDIADSGGCGCGSCSGVNVIPAWTGRWKNRDAPVDASSRVCQYMNVQDGNVS